LGGIAEHRRRSPVTFFVLVLALSVPFWIAGALIDLSRTLPLDLPVSSLQTVCPLIAALILLGKDGGSPGRGRPWKRIVDPRGITPWFWYLPTTLLAPGIVVLSYAVLILSGAQLPDLQMALLAVPIFVVVFLLAAVGEALGVEGRVLSVPADTTVSRVTMGPNIPRP
jgi:CAAX protease family protein